MPFDGDDDAPIQYIERTRDYYLALGYAVPYRWAHFDDVPFTRPATPLSRSRLALVTTAAPYQPQAGDQGPGAGYNAAAKFFSVYSAPTDAPPDLGISHVSYDREHAGADDSNAWFPLERLREAAAAGRIGGLTRRFHGAPTNRSRRVTIERDAPEVLARCREDGAEAAVLVPL